MSVIEAKLHDMSERIEESVNQMYTLLSAELQKQSKMTNRLIAEHIGGASVGDNKQRLSPFGASPA